MACYREDRRMGGDVREEGEEFGGLAGVRDEEYHIILLMVSLPSRLSSNQ